MCIENRVNTSAIIRENANIPTESYRHDGAMSESSTIVRMVPRVLDRPRFSRSTIFHESVSDFTRRCHRLSV